MPDEAPPHMYTPGRMARNLGQGTVGEAFFRWLFDTSIASTTPGIRIRPLGYNPQGIVVGREKVEMLKALRESPDYLVERETSPGAFKPVVGISINTQRDWFTMHQARAPWLCWKCERGAQEACFKEEVGNLWYNAYNITNDYKGFVSLVGVDVLLVTIRATWFSTVWERVKNDHLEASAHHYARREPGEEVLSRGQDPAAMTKFLNFLTHQRGNPNAAAREFELVWLPFSTVASGEIPHSIAGAPVSRGLPRKVYCVDKDRAREQKSFVSELQHLAGRR